MLLIGEPYLQNAVLGNSNDSLRGTCWKATAVLVAHQLEPWSRWLFKCKGELLFASWPYHPFYSTSKPQLSICLVLGSYSN